MRNVQQHATDEELKQYLRSLSASEVSQLLQFEIDCCAACRSAYAIVTNASTTRTHSRSTDLAACGKCEFGLWNQFLKLQIPPPTPLHPKCLSIKFSSRKSLSVESCMSQDIVQRRRNRARFENPRLFQLMRSNNHNGVSAKRKQNRQTMKSSNEVEWDVFAKRFTDPWGQSLGTGCTEAQVTIFVNATPQ
uniref:Uncharacterized protein n=1 Tax=Leptocylindrus danicus TaxID=163516 RepID=A0A7S2KXL8_9STRA|mmetsp:Transcript_28581/g.42050  ORF Transcript_28581/g.42050 Transcript_28581/m.42050 type:complete len:191 (+) Transcript_28581:57-629(+)